MTRLIASVCSLAALMIVAYGFFTLSDNSWVSNPTRGTVQTSTAQLQPSETGQRGTFNKPRASTNPLETLLVPTDPAPLPPCVPMPIPYPGCEEGK